MAGRVVEIFDSTLRDGSQGEGLSFSVEDKLRIVDELDALGVAYIEAGNPGSNVKDLTFFQRLATRHLSNARIVAFGSTRRHGVSCDEDRNLASLLEADVEHVAIFGKSWDFQVTGILKITLEENLELISSSVAWLKGHGRTVFFDAEHFFDGWKENREYAIRCLRAAVDAGADTLVLCETRGGMLPDEVHEAVSEVVGLFPHVPVAIHAHNDSGCAVASSLMAVKAGAVQVQGTLLGIGERCGNADLSTIIADLELKMGIRCISGRLDSLAQTCRTVAALSNINIASSTPYIGSSAFAHKGGMHIDGVLKDPSSFEHVRPEQVGSSRVRTDQGQSAGGPSDRDPEEQGGRGIPVRRGGEQFRRNHLQGAAALRAVLHLRPLPDHRKPAVRRPGQRHQPHGIGEGPGAWRERHRGGGG